MPKLPSFTPKFIEGRGWRLTIPPDYSETGKRERKHFEEESHAEKFAKKLRGQQQRGERGVNLDRKLTVEARDAAKILEGTGISLVDAARMAKDAHKTDGKGESFADRYKRALVDGETRWRPPYLRDMGKLPNWVSKEFMARACDTITIDGVKSELRGRGKYKPSTIDHRARYISAILNFKERHRKAKKIHISPKAEVELALDACETKDERRVVAILYLAGVRPSAEDGEISKLDWESFSAKEIYVSPEASKWGERHITITPRLKREIRGHPKSGLVAPSKWKKSWQRIRKAAGISDKSDITRHTFASNFLTAFGEDKAKAAMGHTANSRTLFRHYRAAVTEADGKAYFA